MRIEIPTRVVLEKVITRKGSKELLDYIDESSFWSSPASMKYHGAYPQGLVKHSVLVWRLFAAENRRLQLGLSDETVCLVALFHDICKAGAYKEVQNPPDRRKNSYGYTYTWNKDQPKGHGTLSVQRLSTFVDLTDLEVDLVKYHMGPWYTVQQWEKGDYALLQMTKAWSDKPSVRFLYFCDELATKMEEVVDGKHAGSA